MVFVTKLSMSPYCFSPYAILIIGCWMSGELVPLSITIFVAPPAKLICDRDYDDTPTTRQNTLISLLAVRGVWVKIYGVIVSTDTCLHPQWTARFEPRGLMVAKPTELRAVGRLSG